MLGLCPSRSRPRLPFALATSTLFSAFISSSQGPTYFPCFPLWGSMILGFRGVNKGSLIPRSYQQFNKS